MSGQVKPSVPAKSAHRMSAVKKEAAVYRLVPPLERDGETHERVIVAAANAETHVFPVFGKPRTLGSTTGTNVAAALKTIGYSLVVAR